MRELVALQQSDVLDGAFAWNGWQMTLTGRGVPEAVPTQHFSADGLNVLGVNRSLQVVFLVGWLAPPESLLVPGVRGRIVHELFMQRVSFLLCEPWAYGLSQRTRPELNGGIEA